MNLAPSSSYLTPRRMPSSDGMLDRLASEVVRARHEGRHVDASHALEKWVLTSRGQAPAFLGRRPFLGEGGGSGGYREGGSGSGGKAFVSLRRLQGTSSLGLGGGGAGNSEATDVAMLQEREAKLRRLVADHGSSAEDVLFMAFVQKHNAHGRVQHRLLAVSDQAVYNVSSSGHKCKRRIPLRAITHVTASESCAQFVLHVPSEYDYLYAEPSRGWDPRERDTGVPPGPPLTALIAAIRRAWAMNGTSLAAPGQDTLPVRTYNDATSLASLVKLKAPGQRRAGSSAAVSGGMAGDHGDDDDD